MRLKDHFLKKLLLTFLRQLTDPRHYFADAGCINFMIQPNSMKWSKPIVVFVILAYSISWLTFVLLALNHHQLIFLFQDNLAHARVQDVWHSFGALGPILAALITLRLFYNKKNRRQFQGGYSVKKLSGKAWLLSFSPLIIFIISLLLSRVVQHQWFDIPGFFQSNDLLHPASLLAWVMPILFYGFGEEGGWRGYALPALQARYSAFKSTVILSVIWICWHIPSFFYRYELKCMAYLGFVLGIFAGAIWLTFLFNYTRGNILAVSLWHLTFNAVSMLAKNELFLSALISVMVMLLATWVLLKYKPANLSPYENTSLQPESLRPKFSDGSAKTRMVTQHEQNQSSG